MRQGLSNRRGRSWWVLAAAGLATGSLGGCLGTIQRELEVLFAADALENALLIPQSYVYQMFGPVIFEVFGLR